MKSIEQVKELLKDFSFPFGPESVPLDEAAGRFLYEPVASPVDVQITGGEQFLLSAGKEFLAGGMLGPYELSLLAVAGFSRVMVRSVCTLGLSVDKPQLLQTAIAGIRRAGGWTETLDPRKSAGESPFSLTLMSAAEVDLPSPWTHVFSGLNLIPAQETACFRHPDGRIVFCLPESILVWQVIIELLIRPLLWRMNGADYQSAVLCGTATEDFPVLPEPGCIPLIQTASDMYRVAGLPETFRECLPPFSTGFLHISPGSLPPKTGDSLRIIPW